MVADWPAVRSACEPARRTFHLGSARVGNAAVDGHFVVEEYDLFETRRSDNAFAIKKVGPRCTSRHGLIESRHYWSTPGLKIFARFHDTTERVRGRGF